MIVDHTTAEINSELIVTMAKMAFRNLDSPVVKSQIRYMSHDAFRRQFGTVKISLPRQQGHTTAALQLLYEYPNSLLFVPKHARKEDCIKLLRHYTSNAETLQRLSDAIVVPSENGMLNIKPKERDFAIFDQAYSFSPKVFQMVDGQTYGARVVVELQG